MFSRREGGTPIFILISMIKTILILLPVLAGVWLASREDDETAKTVWR
jgi:hypothetical protein